MTPSAIRAEFEQELENLNDNLLRLGSMVDTAIKLSMQALEERDEKLAHQVVASDEAINAQRYKLENACLETIAKQQPVARDLRFIIAVMNIVPDLERMGDHAAGIAKIAIKMGNQAPLKPLIDLPAMASIAREMLMKSLHAFSNTDIAKANDIIKMDDEVDRLYEQIFRELLSFMLEDPRTVTRAMYLLFVAHNLERTADRATNICERVNFRATGDIEETPGNDGVIGL